MKKILSLFAMLVMVLCANAGEKVIYSWPGVDKANSVTLAEGVTLTITGNADKTLSGASSITVNGTKYTSIKLSNGAQNTLTLPKKAVGITFYSYVNKNSTDEGLRDSYWKEVAGVSYDAETSGGLFGCFKDDLSNPDARSYTFDATDVITFTNTGEQCCFVIEVEYAEDGADPDPEVDPVVIPEGVIYSWPGVDAANSIELAEGVILTITGNSGKNLSGASSITARGTKYTTIKLSNGAQNTLTLSKKATGINFYSYVNKNSTDEGLRDSYWKEVAGVSYDAETSGGLFTCFKDGDLSNPDVRSYTFDATDVITFTNAGEQCCFVIEVVYAEEEEVDPAWVAAIETAERLVDEDAVAVGLLKDAIEAAKAATGTEEDYAALNAAVEQFKANNADQEKDVTSKVKTDGTGWFKFEGTEPAGVCSTQYAPAITTYDGRTVQLMENYETTVATTGQIIYQNISGLENGNYKVGFYANAFFTPGRGFESEMRDGATDVAYVFANEKKSFIEAVIATETTENKFSQFEVEVTDGNLKIGIGKAMAGTNWHCVQIYQLTWFTTAKEVYANDKAEMTSLIATAEALAKDEYKTENQSEIAAAISDAKAALVNNRLNLAEFEAAIKALEDAIAAFKKANLFTYNGPVYIIDAETGKFMAAGHDWGTRGIVNEIGLDLTLATNTETNMMTIDTQVSNGGNSHFLGTNLYMDAPAAEWAFEYVGFGFYIGNGTQYLSIDGSDNLVLSDTPREWILVTPEGVYAERMEEMAKASEENPVDATFLLKNPNFNRNDLRVAAWTISEDCNNSNLNGGNNTNNCAESYHSTFTISQKVENVPAGLYTMTAQGFYRQDDGVEEPAPVFFANDVTAEVPAKTGEEGNMSDASNSFAAGAYTIEPIQFQVGEDGILTVGVKNEANIHQWVIFDNFVLTYLGPAPVETVEITLDEEADNTAILAENDGEEVDVTLTRTLVAGCYNTFAVPFAIASLEGTPLEGATVKQLASSEFDEETNTLTLNFEDAPSIEAGKPYLVKVAADVVNPSFEAVTISKAPVATETTHVDFIPTLGKTTVEGDANSVLYLGAGDKVYYPATLPEDMKGFRAYFVIHPVSGPTDEPLFVRNYVLSFNDVDAIKGVLSVEDQNNTWYNINGVQLNAQPSTKGVYIMNGKKVILK